MVETFVFPDNEEAQNHLLRWAYKSLKLYKSLVTRSVLEVNVFIGTDRTSFGGTWLYKWLMAVQPLAATVRTAQQLFSSILYYLIVHFLFPD